MVVYVLKAQYGGNRTWWPVADGYYSPEEYGGSLTKTKAAAVADARDRNRRSMGAKYKVVREVRGQNPAVDFTARGEITRPTIHVFRGSRFYRSDSSVAGGPWVWALESQGSYDYFTDRGFKTARKAAQFAAANIGTPHYGGAGASIPLW